MRLWELPDTLLGDVCDCLATERDVMEEFLEAFGFPGNILKDFPPSRLLYRQTKQPRDILFGILKKHSFTPVQLLRNVCASLCDDDVVVELLDNALRSYKPAPPLHFVRPLEEIRDIHNERRQRKPITYLKRGAILIVDHLQFPVGNELESFFMDLDPTNKVTRLTSHAGDFKWHFNRILYSWQQNQGE